MDKFRFGRRLALPSTRQIKHELRLMQLADSIARLKALEAHRSVHEAMPQGPDGPIKIAVG